MVYAQEASVFVASRMPVTPWASATQTAALLRSVVPYRLGRMEAAELAGTSCVTINAWIKSRRFIGVAKLRRGFKRPQ